MIEWWVKSRRLFVLAGQTLGKTEVSCDPHLSGACDASANERIPTWIGAGDTMHP